MKKIFITGSVQENLTHHNTVMGLSHKFEDMEIWQEARVLVREVRAMCKSQLVRRDFIFIDQITRAARSILYNIAEGAEAQTNPEFVQFLGYAKRSAGEVRAQLHQPAPRHAVPPPVADF